MSTLIKNVGVLDARKAAPEVIRSIGKLNNVGILAISPENKAEFARIAMENVGSMLELEEDYKFHTGNKTINRQLLEDADPGIKLCLVGMLTVEPDVTPELLQTKLLGLYLVGQAMVPERLYGAFMRAVKEVTGNVEVIPDAGPDFKGQCHTGKLTLTNSWLEGLADGEELMVVGKLALDEALDPDLFARKVKALRVSGVILGLDTQEQMLRKVLLHPEQTKLKLAKAGCHNLSNGERLDAFALMSITKPLVCSSGKVILEGDVTTDLLAEKEILFEAAAVYFPKALMQAMFSRLVPPTKGFPYEPETLELVTGEQRMTSARLDSMTERSTLVVIGELEIDPAVKAEAIAARIATLDNYGKITASADVASILQSRLRSDEGCIDLFGKEESSAEEQQFDHVIENVATYVL